MASAFLEIEEAPSMQIDILWVGYKPLKIWHFQVFEINYNHEKWNEEIKIETMAYDIDVIALVWGGVKQ